MGRARQAVASAVAVAPRGNFKKLQGGNLRVLVELWARTTEWHQQYRELTENAIQAITEGPGTGTVTWRAAADLLPGARKLSCIDDGHGMSGPEMVRYMNTLAASGRQQGVGQNHGIGAKITTLASNREGVEVRSWVDGVGARVYLTLDGIKEMRPGLPDPERYFEPLAGNQGKPKEIGDHGTMVVLMGNRPDADTTALPEKAKGGGQTRWLPKYLNGKYARLPEGVVLTATEKNGVMRRVHGLHHWLGKTSLASGAVDVDGARVHWWLLNEKNPQDAAKTTFGGAKRTGVSAYALVDSHVAVLHGSESYGLRTSNEGHALLREAGALHGASRVALHVEPSRRTWMPNPERTRLFNSSGTAFSPRAALREFAENMPPVLAEFIEAESQKESARYDPNEDIVKRLDRYADLFRTINAARPVRRAHADSEHEPDVLGSVYLLDGGGEPIPGHGTSGQGHPDQNRHGPSGSEVRHGNQGGQRARRDPGTPTKAVLIKPNYPRVCMTDDPEFKAVASYDRESNEIIFNAGAPPVRYVINEAAAAYHRTDKLPSSRARRDAVKDAAQEAVINAMSMAVVEAVTTAPGTAQSMGWDDEQLQRMFSDEALSVVKITSELPAIHAAIKHAVG